MTLSFPSCMLSAFAAVVITTACTAASSASPAPETASDHRLPPPRPAQDGPPPLPPEAFEACNGKKAGDACSVRFQNHDITGLCAQTPDQRLFCRPDGPPPSR